MDISVWHVIRNAVVHTSLRKKAKVFAGDLDAETNEIKAAVLL